jgi:fructoselysine-6-P-deglycase FrlB-like protein
MTEAGGGAATRREVSSQPALWRRAAEVAAQRAEALPPTGSRTAVVGCGTSLYMAQSYAAARETAGQGETDAFPASEFPLRRRYERVVAISRSGTTTELLHLLERLAPEQRTVAITADERSPLGELAGTVVALPFADEQSVVQTRFATSVIALLRTHLGENIEPVADGAEDALRAPLPVDVERFERFVFLGTGPSVGLAEEAALKLREAAAAWSEAYPAMEYRHGPLSVAGSRSLVWMLTAGAAGMAALAADVSATGATVVQARRDPLAELVLVHRAALALAAARGLDPDAPANLSRSVVLPA